MFKEKLLYTPPTAPAPSYNVVYLSWWRMEEGEEMELHPVGAHPGEGERGGTRGVYGQGSGAVGLSIWGQ